MKPHLRYFWYVLRHKWFVFVAGVALRVPLWQLLIHDWSKFTRAEWGGYVAHFYQDKTPATQAGFDRAWNHHQKANPHHWQYWLLLPDQARGAWRVTSPDGGMSLFSVGDNHAELCVMAQRFQAGETQAEWLVQTLNQTPLALEMPERYVREMVADWCGAGRAITGRWEVEAWYARSPHIVLHPATRERVAQLITQFVERRRGL